MNGQSLVSVARSDCRRLWYGVQAAGVFLIVALVQGRLRPGYDGWQQAISALSLGTGGWVQDACFALFGCGLLTTVPVWRRILGGGIGATTYPVLTALLGLSLIGVAWFPQDPAPGYDPEQLGYVLPTKVGLVHLSLAGVGAVSTCAALFVMASRFDHLPDWRRWGVYTRVAAALTLACVIVYAAWSTQPRGLAGMFERLVVLIPGVWGYAVISRLSAGVPFIVSRVPAGAQLNRVDAA
jgi:hypothetical protein